MVRDNGKSPDAHEDSGENRCRSGSTKTSSRQSSVRYRHEFHLNRYGRTWRLAPRPPPARSSRAARLTWSRQPRGRPAGLPDRPFANRPRRCRTSCFPCFIWSRSGIGNSFNRNCTRLRVPMPGRLQCEYGDCMIIYLLNPPTSNGQQADRETLIGTRGFIRSARSLPNSIEFQGRFARESACADYLSERGWPGGFNCPGCGDGRAWLRRAEALPTHFACNL